MPEDIELLSPSRAQVPYPAGRESVETGFQIIFRVLITVGTVFGRDAFQDSFLIYNCHRARLENPRFDCGY